MERAADRDANRHLRNRFEDVYAQYERLRSGMDELQQRIAASKVTVTSADGQIRVTVGPRGQLLDLELADRALKNTDGRSLAREITKTIQAATERAIAETQQLVGEYLPEGSGAVDFIKDSSFSSLMRRSDAVMSRELRERESQRDA